MSAVCSNTAINSHISPVTFLGIKLNTWHDKDQLILRLFTQATLVNGIMIYELAECNQSTIQDPAQFERLIDKDYIFVLKDKKIIAFPNFPHSKERHGRTFFLHKGKEDTPILLGFTDLIRMSDLAGAQAVKASLKTYSWEFAKK